MQGRAECLPPMSGDFSNTLQEANYRAEDHPRLFDAPSAASVWWTCPPGGLFHFCTGGRIRVGTGMDSSSQIACWPTATMAVGQHAICEDESIPVPTRIRPPVQKWNSSQGGQVHDGLRSARLAVRASRCWHGTDIRTDIMPRPRCSCWAQQRYVHCSGQMSKMTVSGYNVLLGLALCSEHLCIFGLHGAPLSYTHLSLCVRACMFLIVGQTSWPMRTKLGTRTHLDQGSV